MHWFKKVLGIVVIGVVVGIFFLQYKFKTEVLHILEKKIPSHIILQYQELDASIFSGTIELNLIQARFKTVEENTVTSLKANKIKVIGFSLWHYFLNKTIAIEDIILVNPDLDYYKNYKETDKPKDSASKRELDKSITIDKISFINGSIRAKGYKNDSLIISIDSISFNLIGLSTDAYKLNDKLPFRYKDYNVKSKGIFINMSKYENLKIEKLDAENGKLNLQNVYIEPKYTKQELSTVITTERDHLELHIPELVFSGLYFGFNNSKFYVTVNTGEIIEPKLVVFRDKRIADNFTRKKMYSKMLRQLPLKVDFSKLNIVQGHVSYSERIEDKKEAGEIVFETVNASISNLSNTYKKGQETIISASSEFMGEAPMELEIRFDVNAKNDAYLVSGQFKNFDAQIANSFFESNLNAKTEGKIEQIYFTFNGNNLNSKGDFKMKYKAFKFKILNNKNKVNKLLTAIGNLFINNGSKTDIDGYRHGNIDVERDHTKSFFNYIWINIEDGLISTLTGDGEKK